MRIGRWLARTGVIARLRSRMRVKELSRGPATLCAVDCSQNELYQLHEVDPGLVVDVVNAVRYEVGATGSTPRLLVLCFGRDARLDRVTEPIKRCIEAGLTAFCTPMYCYIGLGVPLVWLSGGEIAVTTFRLESIRIEHQVVHELTHALLNALTDGFPYPWAMQEGLAQAMTLWVASGGSWIPPRGISQWDGRKWTVRRSSSYQEHPPIRELLSWSPKALHHAADSEDKAERATFAEGALWLFGFFANMARQCPVASRVFRELRTRNIRTPDGVYEWLQGASEMSAEDLEVSFYRYCLRAPPD